MTGSLFGFGEPESTFSIVHFSSKTDLWYTPREFFQKLDKEFGFTLDVCATEDNAVCEKFYTVADDGLVQPWYGVCWMNPP
jgi:phage N-6-adenine-methyltransferase